MKYTFLFINLVIPSAVFAEEEKTSLMEPLSIGSMLQVFAGLAAVLLLFGGLVFVLKRMGSFRQNQGGRMHVVDGVSVSARDRILLIQVGDKQVLVGVSPGGISPMTVFDEPVISLQEANENGFAGQLQKQLKNRLSSNSKNTEDPS